MLMSILPVCVYMPGALGSQKRVSDPIELQLQAVVTHRYFN